MNIFFGAGKIGMRYLRLWQKAGLRVDYFVDNNDQVAGKKIDDVEVVSPNWLSKEHQEEIHVYITCADAERVYRQLTDMGIPEMRIELISLTATLIELVRGSGMEVLRKYPVSAIPVKGKDGNMPRVLFDLQNGVVLGGVESWSIQSARKLEVMGIATGFLVGGSDADIKGILKEKVYRTGQKDIEKEWGWLERTVLEIVRCRSVLVCNFIGNHLMAACFAKKFFRDTVRIIAVIHNDEEAYYDSYMKLESYIDKCLVISEKIRKKLTERGFPEKKCLYLPWEISCDESLKRVCSEKGDVLRLGYAGRVVQRQKRADCLVEVAKQIKNQGIPFILEVAGEGNYRDMLENAVEAKGMSDTVRCIGVLEHRDIDAFWKHQDIMVSCSEWEGHSITQSEAMAAGAVPVITDVSGAEDDITDGYNGFIVPVGDIDALADRICYLNQNRNELKLMGMRAHRTIYDRQKNLDLAGFWNDLLREVWQS